jgi:nucleolysin TIA-1/TIAR
MPNHGGYGQMPGSAGGYGRGQPTPGAGWNQGQQGPQSHNFGNNGYAGYQG